MVQDDIFNEIALFIRLIRIVSLKISEINSRSNLIWYASVPPSVQIRVDYDFNLLLTEELKGANNIFKLSLS